MSVHKTKNKFTLSMSTFDNFDNIKYQINRFIGPIITVVLGIVLYLKTVTETTISQFNPNGDPILHQVKQSPEFMIASLLLIVVGIVWLLYVLNVLKSFIGVAVTILTLVAAVFILNKDYTLIKKDVDFINQKAMTYKEIKGRINDIKIAQNEFKNEYGFYTNNMDSLIDYVKNGFTIKYERKGLIPNRKLTREESRFIYGKRSNKALDFNMTAVEAKALLNMVPLPEGLENFQRDTVYVPVIESVFQEDSYITQRKKKNLIFDFVPDSLKFIPFSGNEVIMDTASVSRGDLKISTLLIQMPHAIDTSFTHTIGDTTDNSLKDNWSL